MRSKVWFLGMLLGLSSCQYFKSAEQRTEEIVTEKWKVVDKQSVTQLPLFSNCDELASTEEKENCFFDTLHRRCRQLLKDLPKTSQAVSDSVFITFRITEKGRIQIDKVEGQPETLAFLPKNFKVRLEAIGDLQPAYKEGIPVAVKMQLPLLLKSE